MGVHMNSNIRNLYINEIIHFFSEYVFEDEYETLRMFLDKKTDNDLIYIFSKIMKYDLDFIFKIKN